MDHENKCTNCEKLTTGNFCSHCGQSVYSRRGPIWRMLGELTEDIFTIDSKFYTSISALFLKPGYLTTEFVSGRRVSILPPVRMYLVVSIVFFLIFQIEAPDVSDKNVYIGNILIGREAPDPNLGNFKITDEGNIKWFSELIADRKDELQQSNSQIVINKMFNVLEKTLPNALLLFLPLFAFVLKGLYLFKRVLYFDHLLFVLHFQTWLMCWIMLTYGMVLISPWWAFLTVLIPIYLAKAQKKTYQQSYWLVVPKTFLIFLVYGLILVVLGASSLFFSMIII